MKNKIFTTLALLSLITFSGCQNDNSSSNKVNPSSTSSSSVEEVIDFEDGRYYVQVLLQDGSKAPAGVEVQWCDDSSCQSSVTNNDGIAVKKLDAKTYDVHVYFDGYVAELGLKATSENRVLTITLLEIQELISGEGSSSNPYQVNEGTYNVSINTENEIVYFSFKPTKVGNYLIESYYTSTMIDPYANIYNDNLEIISTSDNDGYDSNFLVNLEVSEEDLDKTILFGLSGTGFKRAKTYPFVIKCLG